MLHKNVFCIIVTYNGMKWIDRCISDLGKSSLQTNIVVVDNNSTDGTVDFIVNNFPAVQLIETGKNLGFGQGNNVGLSIAIAERADHIFLLNQDAYVEADTIEKLVATQVENPGFGIISPLHFDGTGKDFDEHFFRFLIKSDIRELITAGLVPSTATPSMINTPFVNAAAWLISRDCLIKTGGFDPIFFHYGEDDNYAQRVLFKGFKIGIFTGAKIFHDKDRPEETKLSAAKILKGDKIIFLNQACDLHNENYRILLFKRFLRYSLFTVASLLSFNSDATSFNYGMTKHIFASLSKIKISRQKSATDPTPFLQN